MAKPASPSHSGPEHPAPAPASPNQSTPSGQAPTPREVADSGQGYSRRVSVDPDLDDPGAKAPTKLNQVQFDGLVENRDAIKAMIDSGSIQPKGKAVFQYIESGDPSSLSPAQADFLLGKVKNPAPPPAHDHSPEPPMDPEDAPSPSGPADKTPRSEWPLTPDQVNLVEKTVQVEGVPERLHQWEGAGYLNHPPATGGAEVRGQFDEAMAARQSVYVGNKAADLLNNWDNAPEKPQNAPANWAPKAPTVGEAAIAEMSPRIAKMDRLPEQVAAVISAPEVIAQGEANRRALVSLEIYEKGRNANNPNVKPEDKAGNFWDKAPQISDAAKFASARVNAGHDASPEAVAGYLVQAMRAGTQRQLGQMATAEGVDKFRQSEIYSQKWEPRSSSGNGGGQRNWGSQKPYNEADPAGPKVQQEAAAMVHEKQYENNPNLTMGLIRKLGLMREGVTGIMITKGDTAQLRKAGLIEARNEQPVG